MSSGSKGLTTSATLLIAACGLNCRLCRAYIRKRNPCPGCRVKGTAKSVTRIRCEIKTCARRQNTGEQFCGSCTQLPCQPMQRLDKRYRAKYMVSPIANVKRIKAIGVRRFVREEKDQWLCKCCGEVLCMHNPQCVRCGEPWHEE
jgi:hypothetical protein